MIMVRLLKNSARLWIFRYQKQLSAAYVAFLIILLIIPFLYLNYAPFNLDYGIPILIRSLAYKLTFNDVNKAEYLIQRGDYAKAEKILVSYLSQYSGIKAGQLRTHAYIKACDLLSDIYKSSERFKKAIEIKRIAVEILPLSYLHWYQLGKLYLMRGDISNAKIALGKSFKLAPNNTEVFNLYSKTLFETMEYERFLWAYDQFIRAQKRIRPYLSISLGSHRNTFQEKLMELCGIPIKGKYLRVLRLKNLQRSAEATIEIPAYFFRDWPFKQSYLLLEFENAFEDIEIKGLTFIFSNEQKISLNSNELKYNYLGYKYSGGKKKFEIEISFDLNDIQKAIISYSVSSNPLSPEIKNMLKKAKLNLVVLQ